MDTKAAILQKAKKVTYNPFENGVISAAVPTTEAQREIWATLKMDKQSTLCYNETLAVSLQGKVNHEAIKLAFQEILKGHDSLRAVFAQDGKTFLVKEYSYQEVPFIDMRGNPARLKELLDNEVKLAFDLINGPCARAYLVQTNSEEYSFILTAHHIICDGWSFAVLLTEFSQTYSELAAGRSLAQISASKFTDFAVEEYKQGFNKEDKAYWLNKFNDDIASRPIPLDFPRPKFRTYDSNRIDLNVPLEIVKGLKKLGSRNGVSFYTVLMASFNVFLHKLSGSEDIVVGMASATQPNVGQFDLVGHLVNLLPLRTRINSNLAFIDLLKTIRKEMFDAFEHQSFSYGPLLKNLNIQRDPSQIPLLNTVFNIDQQSPGQGLKFQYLEASYITVPRICENFELFLNVVSCEDKLVIECQYNINLFKAETIGNWLNSLVDTMGILIENDTITPAQLVLPNLHIPTVVNSKVIDVKEEITTRDPELELAIIKIWKKVLGIAHVEAEDNFFNLGGHSLLAVEIANLLQDEFKTEYTIKDIFECPTVQELATRVKKSSSLTSHLSSAPKATGLNKFSVSHNQMQVWYLEEMFPRTTMHNLPASIRIKTEVDVKVLEKTLHILIKRHPSLRTSIVIENGAPVQKVADFNEMQPLVLNVIKASEESISEVLNKESNHVFNKEEAPLFKAKLYQLGKSDFVFYFMVHHAIWDGWCFDIFFDELDTVYSALVNNRPVEFTRELGISYIDFTSWQSGEVGEARYLNQVSYWKTKLSSPLPVLEVPSDHRRPKVASHEGGTIPFTLSKAQAESVRSFARATGSSVYNVLLMAFKVILAKYTNQNDIIVGTPLRGRNRPELLNTIGYFVNTAALRSLLNPSDTLEEILKTVNSTSLEALANQDVPFQVILNEVSYERDSSRTPIFQSFFSYQDVSNRLGKFNGVSYSQINIDKASTHTDLDMWIKANDVKIEGALEYRKDLFESGTIERFKDCFVFLLENLSFYTKKTLSEISIIPAAQIDLIQKEWNNTKLDTTGLRPIHETFEKIAATNPHKVAIEMSTEFISYGALNDLANRCAHGLITQGVKRGELVGISLNRGIDLLVAILGVLKTGAGYVPLDPGFPQDRLDYMIESSQPKLLLTEDALQSRFMSPADRIILKDLVMDNSLKVTNPRANSELKDTMYVIYTSGSTGKPKGVQVGHSSVANFLNSMSKIPGISSKDKLLAVTTLSFDIAVLELFLPLTAGATVYLASGLEVLDGAALKGILETKNITYMQATPSTWRLLLASRWTGNKDLKILCGGEAFPKDLADKLIPISHSVWNMYGPTETTVWSTLKKLDLSDEYITIGRPIDNTEVFVLDENLKLAPIGSAGELFIAGDGLALGYFGRPDLTQERFISHPSIPGKLMYATGDQARFTSNGEIECLGRKDGQVKIRGYRIELGEIEVELSKFSGVLEAAVVTREYRPGDVRIVAFYSSQSSLEEKALREALGAKLPKYMVPSHFINLKSLPKTLNGKIDKKSLPQITSPKTEQIEAQVSQTTSDTITDKLKGLWLDVLGCKNFSEQENFFNLGGNSLLAVQLLTRLSANFGINLPLSVLLEAPEFSNFVNSVKASLPSESKTMSSAPSIPNIFTSLIQIRSGGKKNPLYCFHGVGGNVLNYVALAGGVDKERPFYALQSRGADGKVSFLNSIEEMAAHYIREIKLVQPTGPYLLAGGSMGGTLAFEVARQLTELGDSVEKLIMFDTFGPNINIKSYDPAERSFFKDLKISLEYRGKSLLNKVRTLLFNALGMPIPLSILLFNLELNNYKALWKYRPQKYKGDLHLIRAKGRETGWYSDPLMGWKDTIEGQISTYEISGSHGDFIESPEINRVLATLL